MRKVNVFLITLVASLAALFVLVAAGFYVFTAPATQSGQNWMSNMWGNMGGMMGGYSGTQVGTAQNSAWPYLGVGFIVLIVIAVVGLSGVAYFIAFPEITTKTFTATQHPTAETATSVENGPAIQQPSTGAFESVAKTLTSDEKRVLDVLSAHEGHYLQKYIRSETGLSRLQTHRIVARLAERGIVTLEKTGNTNQVYIADWLQK